MRRLRAFDVGILAAILPAMLVLLLILSVTATQSQAQFFGSKPTDVSKEPVEAAKRALETAAPPWYDAEQDSIKSLIVESDAKREHATKQWSRNKARWTWDWSWWPSFPFFGEFLRFAGWALLIGLIVLLVYALVRAFMNADPAMTSISGSSEGFDTRVDAERIENLPVPVKARKGNFLDIARQFYEDGKFEDAIIYLFSHRLLQLDRAGRIRLTKGKTNRQYLREIKNSKELRKILGRTIVGFEEVFFGKHNLTRERFEECWKQNDNFEQLLSQVTA